MKSTKLPEKTRAGIGLPPLMLRKFTMVAGFLSIGLHLSASAVAQDNPFLGRNQFPQYRQISGLAGGGYGLDFEGYGSRTGATAFSTPLGYGLGRREIRIGGNDTSFRWDKFSPRFKNTTDASAKAFFTYGHTFRRISVTYSYLLKSYAGDASTNLQVAYVPRSEREPGFSVGIQDIIGNGGAAGEGQPFDGELSRSAFAAVTWRVPNTDRPLYVSGGVGTRRFRNGFASASYAAGGQLRIWGEYDGYGLNEGVLLTSRVGSVETNFLAGLIKSRYPTVAFTVGFPLSRIR